MRTQSIEVEPLQGFGPDAWAKRRWMRLWQEVGERILRLPRREQRILLEDLHTAIESRIIVMERMNNAERGN